MVAAVQQWAPLVRAELAYQNIPLPTDLILSVIRVESGGKAGLTNPAGGASGLMQVLPVTLQDYNQRHQDNYTLADMRGEDLNSARAQIRVGLSTLARYWKRAYEYLSSRLPTVPILDLSRIADLFYRAGPGATIKQLDKLSQPTFSALKTAFPDWEPLRHPTRVFKTEPVWNVDNIGNWLEGVLSTVPPEKLSPKQGFAIAIVALAVASWLMSRGK
jgi:hypothetical protein